MTSLPAITSRWTSFLKRGSMPLILFLLISCFGCSCASQNRVLDSQSAIEANDLTAILSGCGQQLAGSGYLVCRETEGQNAKTEFLIVHSPPTLNCKGDACTFVKVFFQNGRPTLEKSILKGDRILKIPWMELINKESFDLSDRGTYSVSVRTHFIGPDGIERVTYSAGQVFMWVVKKNYISLIENENDEAFYWIWKTAENQTLKVTTGYRVYVEPGLQLMTNGLFDQ